MIRPLFTALLLALLACSQGSSAPSEDSSQQETASAEADAAAEAEEATPAEDDPIAAPTAAQVPVAADYTAETREAITEGNYRQALERLEGEISAE